MNTNAQFDAVTSECKSVFISKLRDYGPSWRLMRPSSLTDQIFIKARRIRKIETSGENLVGEDLKGDFQAMVNYGFIALIQCEYGFADFIDFSVEKCESLYEEQRSKTKALMCNKNHDYDEAWRQMRISSFTDIILTKLSRIKEIEDNQGVTTVSEGVEGNYQDIINYSIFALIQMSEHEK
jgi:hypothetical protein